MCHNLVPLADASVFVGVVLPVVPGLLLTHHPHDRPGLVQVSETVVAHPLHFVVAHPLRYGVAYPLQGADAGDSEVAGTALPEDSATVDLAGFCRWI